MRLPGPVALALLIPALTACGGPGTPPAVREPELSVTVQPSPVRLGERLTFGLNLLNTAETWNVALFVEDPDGEVTQLLPNRTADGSSALTGGTARVFPSAEAKFFVLASGTTGAHRVLAYAARQALNLSSISAYASAQDAFATVQPGRQGKGALDGSLLAVLRLENPGVAALTTFTVTP